MDLETFNRGEVLMPKARAFERDETADRSPFGLDLTVTFTLSCKAISVLRFIATIQEKLHGTVLRLLGQNAHLNIPDPFIRSVQFTGL